MGKSVGSLNDTVMHPLVRMIQAFVVVAALATPAFASDSAVRIGVPQQPNTLDPLLASQFYENYLDCAIFSGLTVINADGNVAPDLAREVPTRANGGVSSDGRTIVYRLRPGTRWQDGKPLTADDVVFTFSFMRDPKTAFPALSMYDNVASVAARDSQTVVVRLKRPDPDAIANIFVNGQNGSIVPRHILAGLADLQRSSFSDHPVGSGPYVLESWARGSELRLRANPAYFRGRPKVERLRVEFIPDANTMALQLRVGALDFAPAITPSAVATLRRVRSLHVVDRPSYTLIMLVDRVDGAPLDDVRVRRAFGIAADRATLAAKAYLGFATPASELLPPWSRYATAPPPLPANISAAARLLDEAGWRRGADGFRARSGQRLELTMTTVAGSRALQTAATLLQAEYQELGVDVAIRPVQSNELYAPDGVLAKGNFQFALIGFGGPPTPDRSELLSSRSLPPNGFNYARYRNAAVDNAIVRSAALDPATRRRAFAQIAKAVAADAPYVPLVWGHTIFAIANKLEGVRPEPVNSDLWNVWEWRLRDGGANG